MTSIVNAFTVDVEDWFQVSALAPYVPRDQWDSIHCRVEHNVDRLLSLLSQANSHGTFFVLGWIAARHPAMVRRIAASGHEIASHGSAHRRASDQSPDDFHNDVASAKALLEDLTGTPVVGYRAPSFSIGAGNLWAHEVLARTGHRYSSSVYPVRHDHYGMPNAPRFAHRVRAGIAELPPTTLRIGNRNLPASGGGWFRLLPYPVSRWMIGQVNRKDGQSAIFYCHPWEIDPDQPRVGQADPKTRFRHYTNLSRTHGRLARLLSDFRWDRIDRVFAGRFAEA